MLSNEVCIGHEIIFHHKKTYQYDHNKFQIIFFLKKVSFLRNH